MPTRRLPRSAESLARRTTKAGLGPGEEDNEASVFAGKADGVLGIRDSP
jgi:hypothetical protein